MPARKVISNRQLEMLVSFMEENRGFAVGRLANTDPLAKQQTALLWDKLANNLNAVKAGANRTKAKWRDYWNEKKYGVRKKVTELREHGRGTGGGPGKKWSLTPMEERILAVLGREAVNGITSHSQPDTVASSLASTPEPPPEPVPEAALSDDEDSSPTDTLHAADVPRWAIQIEEQHLANEERVGRALETIADTLAALQRSVARIEENVARLAS